FIDLRERHGPGRLLIPQTTLGAVERLHFSRGRDLIADLQRRCLKASEAQTLEGLSCPWPIHLVPGRGVVDYLLVDGLYRRQGGLARGQAWEAASKSLIAGMDCRADEDIASGNPEAYQHFCRRLLDSFRAREVDDFDSWLKVESERGFFRLLPNAHK